VFPYSCFPYATVEFRKLEKEVAARIQEIWQRLIKGCKLNKKLIGIGLLLTVNSAFAQSANQSAIELYGVVDIAVGRVENSLSTNGEYGSTVNAYQATKSTINTPVTGMINGGIQASRWGIRGREDLGGGVLAFYTLESGFNGPNGTLSNSAASLAQNSPKATSVSSDGSLDGQLFNRQASVGLSDGKLGSIAFGRNYNPIYIAVTDFDPVQQAQLFSPLGASNSIGGGGGVSEYARLDNSINYKNNFGPVNIGLLYKFGGVAGNNAAESGYVLNLGYEAGPFGIEGVYEAFTDVLKGSTSSVAGDINVTNYNTTAYFVAAKYAFGRVTVKGGYESFTLKAPSDSLSSLGVTNLFGYSLGNATSASANFSSANQTTGLWFFGGDYNFTPSVNLSVGFYDQNPKASSDLKQLNGNIYSYSALLDYHFSKRTDVYTGYLYSQYKGADYSAPFAADNSNNSVFAIGIRTKF
jgi:predicted porin